METFQQMADLVHNSSAVRSEVLCLHGSVGGSLVGSHCCTQWGSVMPWERWHTAQRSDLLAALKATGGGGSGHAADF